MGKVEICSHQRACLEFLINVVKMFLPFYAVIHWGTGLYIMDKESG